jgi:hypothetical protein
MATPVAVRFHLRVGRRRRQNDKFDLPGMLMLLGWGVAADLQERQID